MMNSSCIWDYTWHYAAYYRGAAGDVAGSCVGEYACMNAALYGGRLGNVTQSCRRSSCYLTAACKSKDKAAY